MRYSEDLQEVILWMLSKEPSERPSVSDLLAIPKIQLRINERKMKDDYEALKRREEEVYSKYKKLREREKALVERENALTKRTEDAQQLLQKLQQQQQIESQNLMLLSLQVNGQELDFERNRERSLGDNFFSQQPGSTLPKEASIDERQMATETSYQLTRDFNLTETDHRPYSIDHHQQSQEPTGHQLAADADLNMTEQLHLVKR